MIITSALVEAFSQCERKAFLLIQCKEETNEHEYLKIQKEQAKANRLRLALDRDAGVGCFIDEKSGSPYLIRSDEMIADCDALLKSMSGNPSVKANATHEPCLVTGTYRVSKEQRIRLAFAGYVANATKKYRVTTGLVVPLDGQKHRIDLKPLYPKISSIVVDLRKIVDTKICATPKLILNTHCALCPFECDQPIRWTNNHRS
ncbi:MAG: hypothetical protein Q8R67_15055 [Rhodoferax sp.]|nr:hypothetical protein [Rhodoferax sp.]MDP3652995.1 hypothetical protein [Rhodoferax sp.]